MLFSLWKTVYRIASFLMRLCENIKGLCLRNMHHNHAAMESGHRSNVVQVTKVHNMATHPDESYYLRQYWHWLEPILGKCASDGNLPREILDLGCGQGRLTLPLAQWGGKEWRITGVDMSSDAIDYLRQSLEGSQHQQTVQLVTQDALEYLKQVPSACLALVVCSEVMYMIPEYRDVLREVFRVLAPGGYFVVALRGRYYNLTKMLLARNWSAMQVILSSNEGYPFGPVTKFSWFNVREATELLSSYGFAVRAARGLGICSGIEGDPFAMLAQPSRLRPDEQDHLLEVELGLASELADVGRYILFEAQTHRAL